jgi:hypothetical protein
MVWRGGEWAALTGTSKGDIGLTAALCKEFAPMFMSGQGQGQGQREEYVQRERERERGKRLFLSKCGNVP